MRGVGENYCDHYSSRLNWRVKLPVILNEQTRGLALAKEVIKYYAQRRGVLTFTAAIAHGFVRTRPGLAVPDVQYFFTHASYADPAVRELDRAPGMTLSVYQCRPESKGSIHAKSPDPAAAPTYGPTTWPTNWIDAHCAGGKLIRPPLHRMVAIATAVASSM